MGKCPECEYDENENAFGECKREGFDVHPSVAFRVEWLINEGKKQQYDEVDKYGDWWGGDLFNNLSTNISDDHTKEECLQIFEKAYEDVLNAKKKHDEEKRREEEQNRGAGIQ